MGCTKHPRCSNDFITLSGMHITPLFILFEHFIQVGKSSIVNISSQMKINQMYLHIGFSSRKGSVCSMLHRRHYNIGNDLSCLLCSKYFNKIDWRSIQAISEPSFLPVVRPFSETVDMMQDCCISWRAPILSELRVSEHGAPGSQETKKLFGIMYIKRY
jgi:hypothetical protein